MSPDAVDENEGFDQHPETDSKTSDNKIQLQHLAAYPANEAQCSPAVKSAKEAFQTDNGR